MRSIATLLCASSVALLVEGCAGGPALRPARDEDRIGVRDSVAVAEGSGTRLVIDTDAWSGRPRELSAILPIRVSIANDSDHALRLRYDQFALVAPRGRRLTALPPLHVDATGDDPRPATTYDPAFAWRGVFYVAAPYRHYYDAVTTWHGPFNMDPYYNDKHYAMWPAHLPSPDMVQAGLPEGVLGQGASLTGFLYFRNGDLSDRRLTFRMQLVDAQTGAPFGDVDIGLARR